MSTSYDTLRYPDLPYVQTHPERLATAALLHGVEPAAPATSRVLELGCGAGINLINMAYTHPGIRAVGVDLAAEVIADARAAAEELGLANVEFLAEDATAVDLGEFDYVIAHGLWSWVSPEVREAVMGVIARALAPNGIAFVSYNAQPGAYPRGLLRDAAHWFGDGPKLYDELAEIRAEAAGDAWAKMLAVTLPSVRGPGDEFLFHDVLGEEWHAVWFHEFVTHVRGHGLEWMGEAEASDLLDVGAPPHVLERLRAFAAGDALAYQQYIDIFGPRRFRSSLLCRPERQPLRTVDASAVARLKWRSLEGPISSNTPPRELEARFRAARATPYLDPPRVAAVASGRPLASAVARWQAARGESRLAALDHTVLTLEAEAGRELLMLLDGTRDREAIRANFRERTGFDLPSDVLEAQLAKLAEAAVLHA